MTYIVLCIIIVYIINRIKFLYFDLSKELINHRQPPQATADHRENYELSLFKLNLVKILSLSSRERR